MKLLSKSLVFVSAALLCGPASAAETYYAAGTNALPMQQAGGTARAMAMGSAVVAVSQGSASLLWNPAALSRMDCTEVGLHHNTGLGDTIQETAIVGIPLGKVTKECKGGAYGGIAASFGYVDYGKFGGRDDAGVQTRSYGARDFTGSLGWGMKLLPYFSGGITLKNNQSQFPGKIYSSYAMDIGVLWAATRSLDIGVTYSNINLGSLGSNIGGLAAGWRVGAAMAVNKHLLLAASGELQNSSMNRFQLGTEYLIGNVDGKVSVLALRAGYQANFPDPQLNGMTGLTFGLGYTLSRSMTVDYAMLPIGDLGASHRLSLTLKFDCPKKKRPAVAIAIVKPAPAPKPAAVAVATEPAAAPAPVVEAVPAPEPVVLHAFLLEDSHFDFGSSVLRPEGMAALRENVQILKNNPGTIVNVAGYTSARGTEEYNQKLSEQRAAAVANFFLSEGIEPGRISTIGYGEMRPAEYEETDEKDTHAAIANKRVVSTVTEVPPGVELGNTTIRTIKE